MLYTCFTTFSTSHHTRWYCPCYDSNQLRYALARRTCNQLPGRRHTSTYIGSTTQTYQPKRPSRLLPLSGLVIWRCTRPCDTKWDRLILKLQHRVRIPHLNAFSIHTPDLIEPVVCDFWNKRRKKDVVMKKRTILRGRKNLYLSPLNPNFALCERSCSRQAVVFRHLSQTPKGTRRENTWNSSSLNCGNMCFPNRPHTHNSVSFLEFSTHTPGLIDHANHVV
jgi:hypothetical protein